MPAPGKDPSPPIVYFDGVCHICNGFVDFLIRRDRTASVRFASLQGETARANLPPEMVVGLPGVVVADKGTLYFKSAAVIHIVAGLGGRWRLLRLLQVLPAPLRDLIYDGFARRRYRWFGRRETCRMPTAGEQARLLP